MPRAVSWGWLSTSAIVLTLPAGAPAAMNSFSHSSLGRVASSSAILASSSSAYLLRDNSVSKRGSLSRSVAPMTSQAAIQCGFANPMAIQRPSEQR